MAGNLLDLGPFLNVKRLVFIAGNPAKRDMLLQLADLTTAGFLPRDRASFIKAIFDREDVTSTAIGSGIAIPHARLPTIDDCVISIAIIPDGMAFDARDGAPVRIVAMIAARDRDRSEHLRVLASVAAHLQDRARRDRLIAAANADEVIGLLKG